MSSVSPSLVEAAARAIRDPIMLFLEREFHMIATVESDKLADILAPLALAAVGDALRLEGAQAERERWLAVINVERDGWEAAMRVSKGGDDSTEVAMALDVLDDVLMALGGVHPEASP